jgi:hypothetical protein
MEEDPVAEDEGRDHLRLRVHLFLVRGRCPLS